MALPKITLTTGTSPTEGAIGTYFITLDTPAPAGGLTVDYNTLGSTATATSDYQLTAGKNLTAVTDGQFTIAAGAKTATLKLVAVADAVVDPFETVIVNVMAGVGYDLGGDNLTVGFAPATDLTVGVDPFSIISADFNGDGNADVATANGGSDTVSILLGNGSGGFSAQTDFAVGSGPQSVISADFNGDGNADLATANYIYSFDRDVNGNGTVSVLLGNGQGGFAAQTDFSTAKHYPVSVISADFNGDGNADLATANWDYDYDNNDYNDTVSVLLGNGTGGFAAQTDFTVGSTPVSVISADFNGDGNADLAVANWYSESVSVLLGTGTGGFAAQTDFTVGSELVSVISADFNGDGNADLATANGYGGTVSVLLGNGTGGFSAQTDFAVGSNSHSVISADFNGDGNADLATANYISYGDVNGTVSVQLGNGTGGFAAKTDVTEGDSVISADFNGDGQADLVTANYKVNTVSVLLNTGNTLTAALTLTDDGLYVPLTLRGDEGGASPDVLTGGNGADTLVGKDMADTLSGGLGDDTLWGGKDNDNVSGGLGDDVLYGGWGKDALDGGAGDDILQGGLGHDKLTGGAGSDVFRYDSLYKLLAANTDKITDFSVADDTIQLGHSLFAQLTTPGELNPDNFVKANKAQDSNDYVVYNPTTGALLYDADGNGAGAAVKIALLGVDLALTQADFVVI